MELKDRIAAVRKAAGLTQEQLGELVGVSRQAVSKWESGQTVPDAATIAQLCEALHVSAVRRSGLYAAGHLSLLRAARLRHHLPGLRL